MLDVYFNNKYGQLYNDDCEECEEFTFESKFGIVKNIFMKRKIPFSPDSNIYFDVITPYGYGGPICIHSNNIVELIKEYNIAWNKYCDEQNIVSEFVRFHLYDNVNIRDLLDMEIVNLSDNISVDTTYSMDEIWMRFEHKVRKNVKKARNNGLSVIRDDSGEYLDSFLEIYYETMKRNNALDKYYFKKSYFEQINDTLKGQFMYFHTLYEDKIISTELVLCGEEYAYSFLGGTKNEFYDLRPNDLLKYDIIEWCNQTGRKKFILGGGYQKDDGIYRYKKCFAPDNGNIEFFVGKKIHNENIYNKLVEIRKSKSNFNEKSGFFPLYRS